MSKRTVGFVLIFLGLVMLAVSLAADALGIGIVPGIGWKQILGAAAGVVLALGGVWLLLKKTNLKK